MLRADEIKRAIMAVVIRPIQEREDDAVYRMFQDIPAEENSATNHANGLSRSEFDTFCKKMLARSVANARGKKEFDDGKVPTTMYIIFDAGVPVGFGKFRPFLNKACIQNRAGHFAYMISPKYRGKGYATAFLSFVKGEARKMGLAEIEGTTLVKNLASRRVMEKNDGKIKEYTDDEVTYILPLKA